MQAVVALAGHVFVAGGLAVGGQRRFHKSQMHGHGGAGGCGISGLQRGVDGAVLVQQRVAGAALAVALALTLPAALTDAGITGSTATQLADTTRQSAGTTISQLRAEGSSSSLGDQTAAAVTALSNGFADATRWSLLVATVFLLLGFVGALVVRRAAARSAAGGAAASDAGAGERG